MQPSSDLLVADVLTTLQKRASSTRRGGQLRRKCIRFALVGTWLSLVEHCIRDAGVAGSNPVVPTSNIKELGPADTGPFFLESRFDHILITSFH